MRLDCYLVERGFALSRQKAQDLIKRGCVYVNLVCCTRSAVFIAKEDQVEVLTQKQWVSRGGYKLEGFLRNRCIALEGMCVLDIGSSTGGFSEVLLDCGVREVVCVDVGSGQLHPSLRKDRRVVVYENQDIRDFESRAFDFVVCDVSFISLRLLLDKIFSLTSKECLLLFKPQFEVGIEAKRNKKGVIEDLDVVVATLKEFLELVEQMGFCVLACEKSLVAGRNGNEEYFVYLSKS